MNKSLNFEFLRSTWEILAELGELAENYAHRDPVAALIKLRTYCEQIVQWIHQHDQLPRPMQANLSDLLANPPFREVVPEVVLAKMHGMRRDGNKAAHQNKGDVTQAVYLLRDAYNVGRWLYITYGGGSVDDCGEFTVPPEGGAAEVSARREKRAVLERIAKQEAQVQQLIAELDRERQRADKAEASAEERRAALDAALKARDQLQAVDPMAFNEAETRVRLIDQMLADTGWDIAPGGEDTAEVKKEVRVGHQPTESGEGWADYVLYDAKGKPLAVIEAKKTSEEVQKGRNQAKHYADGLEQEHGQRPVIFYTNGYDLWIWDDAAGEPWRPLYGFYSRDSLEHLIFQRSEKLPVSQIGPSPEIAGRMYQIEAVRRVLEKFAEKKRRALIVQATGTGKTRVAISLAEAMIRAKWAKRILFLCDRRELRKQANNAFKEFLPGEPRSIISRQTAHERQHRIYLSTYPGMMRILESYDVGFFDLIIADESHRSLYNRYRQIFQYFDCYQVGLTATPVGYLARNTFGMFDCDDQDPTTNYEFQDAVNHEPPYLVPFEVQVHTTEFLREGIKYSEMTAEQRRQLEEDEVLPEAIDYEQVQVDKHIYNKDTNRIILRNLMEQGVRVAEGSRLGKSILFARSKRHARMLEELFNELYPQYGGKFCQAIVSDDPRAESLIDDFKGIGSNDGLTIAISVDMLDTGIDVPQIVNLVFAKPVYSYVKFWQMIGRGTRLCADLMGPGRDKTHFQIFDHWGNFERFEQGYQRADPVRSKSLAERVFESRLALATAALEKQDAESFEAVIEQIGRDLASLPTGSIPVRERWRQLNTLRQTDTLRRFDAATQTTLAQEIAPLMQWIDLTGQEEAWKFDQLIAEAQRGLILGSSKLDDFRDEIINRVSTLPVNLSQVKSKLALIEEVKTQEFWEELSVADLERTRDGLRGVIRFRARTPRGTIEPKEIDVREDAMKIESHVHRVGLDQLSGLDMAAYRNRVTGVLQAIMDQSPTLQRITRGEPVSEKDLEDLCSLVLSQEPDLDLHLLTEYYPQAAGLELAIRSVVGMDAAAVHKRFETFVQQHPNLASHQIKFLDLLQNQIARAGSIEIEQLYEPPFSTLHNEGPDGLFASEVVDELLEIVDSFQK